jgi:hypothetical protein
MFARDQSQSPSRPQWGAYCAGLVYGTLLGLALLGWILYATRQPSVKGYAYRYDFLNVYVGTRAVVTGQASGLYDLATQRASTDAALAPYVRPLLLPYTYPGYVAVLLAPLGLLSYGTAFVVWDLLNLAIVVWVVGRLVTSTTPVGAERLALAFVAAGFMPVLLGLLQGQFQLVPLLGMVEAVLMLRAGRERAAGAWLLLGLMKPHLVVLPLLALLIWRRWRVLGVFVLGTALITGLSMLVLGNWLSGYLALLVDFTQQGAALGSYPAAMHNWRGLIYALLGSSSSLTALILLIILDILSVGLLVWLCRPQRIGITSRDPREPLPGAVWEAPFAVAILLGLLVSPHLYLHDAVLALPAGFMLWRASSALTPHTMQRRLLRGLLAVGPLIAWIAQFVQATSFPIQIGPWYLFVLLIAVPWVLDPRYRSAPAPGVPAPAGSTNS